MKVQLVTILNECTAREPFEIASGHASMAANPDKEDCQ